MMRNMILAIAAIAAAAPAAAQGTKEEIARGRYLVRTSGCNDCHTPGYGAKDGNVDEKLWMTGDALGWKGPWGTTYAPNLRLLVAKMSAREWVAHVRKVQPRPPMPWFNLRSMTDGDLRAIHAYLQAMGPAGTPAPAFVPPGVEPQGPVVRFP